MTNNQRNSILSTLDGFIGLLLDETITQDEYDKLSENFARLLKTKNIDTNGGIL